MDLNSRKVPTPTAALKAARPSLGWHCTTVRKILTNEVYLGHTVWNRRHEGKFVGVVDLKVTSVPGGPKRRNAKEHHIRLEDTHPAIIDPETFAKVQRQIAARKTRTTPFPRQSPHHLLGLLVCGHCRRRMTGHRVMSGKPGRRGEKIPAYICSTYYRHGKVSCNNNVIHERGLLRAIVAKITERYTPEFFDAFRRAVREELSGGGSALESRRLRIALDASERAITDATDALIREKDERFLGPVRDRLLTLQGERERLRQEIAKAEREEKARPDAEAVIARAEAKLSDLRAVIERGNAVEVRAVLHDLVDRVELYYSHQPHPKRAGCTTATFVRGLVYGRDGQEFHSHLCHVPRSSSPTS